MLTKSNLLCFFIIIGPLVSTVHANKTKPVIFSVPPPEETLAADETDTPFVKSILGHRVAIHTTEGSVITGYIASYFSEGHAFSGQHELRLEDGRIARIRLVIDGSLREHIEILEPELGAVEYLEQDLDDISLVISAANDLVAS